jgi:hypothetical protein
MWYAKSHSVPPLSLGGIVGAAFSLSWPRAISSAHSTYTGSPRRLEGLLYGLSIQPENGSSNLFRVGKTFLSSFVKPSNQISVIHCIAIELHAGHTLYM